MNNDKITIDNLVFNKYIKEQDIIDKISQLSTELNKFYYKKNPLVIGVLNGCIYFMMDLLKIVDFSYSIDFIKAKSYKGMKSGNLNIQSSINPEQITDKYILIVEDIIDSGNTIKSIYSYIEKCNPKDIKIISLLTKVDQISSELSIDWYGFQIENNYVIGYGLDYNNLFRNLKDIYKINEE